MDIEAAINKILNCSDCGKQTAKYFLPEMKSIFCVSCRNGGKYIDQLKNLITVDIDGYYMTYLNALQLVRDVEDFAQTDEFGKDM